MCRSPRRHPCRLLAAGLLALAGLFALAPARADSAAPLYHVSIIDAPQSLFTTPVALNNHGAICGNLATASADSFPFSYHAGRFTLLPNPAGAFASIANAMNNQGQIVGQDFFKKNQNTHAVLWDNGVATDLGTLKGDNNSAAGGINNQGEIAGWSAKIDFESGALTLHPAIFVGGDIIDLTPLSDRPWLPAAIDDAGEMAGTFTNNSGETRALRFRNSVHAIGTLGGGQSGVFGMNDRGEIVGQSTNSLGVARAYLFSHLQMVDIGPLESTVASAALSINHAGEVAGAYWNGTDFAGFAMIDGLDYDLTQQIDFGSPDTPIEIAQNVNDHGQILASGFVQGGFFYLLLTPDDTPESPLITGLLPASAQALTTFTLTVKGSGFTRDSTVDWNETPLPTTFVSNNVLTASVTPSANTTLPADSYPGQASIVLVNTGGASDPAGITVTTPTPVLDSLSPSSVNAGHTSFVLAVRGSGFAQGDTVVFGDTPVSTIFLSSSKLRATVPARLVESPGAVSVTVAGAGGASNSLPFTVN